MEITVENLNFSYNNKKVLKNINFKIEDGEFVGLVGPTGCGKTTLAYCLNGLIPNSIRGKFYGQVMINELDTRKHKVSEIARKVGFVFQDPDWQIFSLSVKDEIEFGPRNFGFVGLEGHRNEDPNQLSQGQRQKLCIASVIATDPEFIILDEPTSQLDYKNSKNIHDILKKINKEGKTVFLIEHDTDFLAEYCSRILVMNDGQIIKDNTTKKVFLNVNLLKRMGIKVPRVMV